MWEELGIEPTRDPAIIRRAYADRLKQTRPDDDPAGFVRLRAAYQSALAHAARPAPAVAQETVAEAKSVEPQETVEEKAALPPAAAEAGQRFFHALRAADVAAAADVLSAAIAAEILPLAAEMELSDYLLAALTRIPALPPTVLREVAGRFGWLDLKTIESGPRHVALSRLQARLEAETWLTSLRSAAAAPRYNIVNETATAARLMLGRGPLPALARVLPPVPTLKRLIAELEFRWPWIADQFDKDRITMLRALGQARYPGWPLRTIWILLWVAMSISIVGATWVSAMPLLIRFLMLRFRQYSRSGLIALALVILIAAPVAVVMSADLVRPILRGAWWPSPVWIGTGVAACGLAVAMPKLFRKLIPVMGLSGARSLFGATGWVMGFGLWVFSQTYHYGSAPNVSPPRPPVPYADQHYAATDAGLRFRAQGGDMASALQLGSRLIAANAGPASDREAAYYLKQAAPLYPQASAGLGLLYETGRGVDQDFAEARRQYQTAARFEATDVQLNLARLLLLGLGGPVDGPGAVNLYMAAARHGSATAYTGIGIAYVRKIAGGPPDLARGVRWLTAAGNAGQVDAMEMLGNAFLSGKVLKADPAAAYRWLALALKTAPSGDPRRADVEAARDKAAGRLKPADRSQIDMELATWKPSPLVMPE